VRAAGAALLVQKSTRAAKRTARRRMLRPVPTRTGLSRDQNLGVFLAARKISSSDGSRLGASASRAGDAAAAEGDVDAPSTVSSTSSSLRRYRVSGSILRNHFSKNHRSIGRESSVFSSSRYVRSAPVFLFLASDTRAFGTSTNHQYAVVAPMAERTMS